MIDIIMPLYNDKKNLLFALASIAMQTINNNITLYLIDDSSSESYKDILELYKDEIRIKYFKLSQNYGPGIARNYGIQQSNGDYIFFMDSDDYLFNPKSLEQLYVYCDMSIDFISGIEYSEKFEDFFNSDNNLHAKLYSRKFIEKYNIHFNSSRMHEDCYFNGIFNVLQPNSIHIDTPIYFYSYNKNSLTSINLHEELLSLETLIKNIKEIIDFSYSHNCNLSALNNILLSKKDYLKRTYNALEDKNDKQLLKNWISDYNLQEIFPL